VASWLANFRIKPKVSFAALIIITAAWTASMNFRFGCTTLINDFSHKIMQIKRIAQTDVLRMTTKLKGAMTIMTKLATSDITFKMSTETRQTFSNSIEWFLLDISQFFKKE
jgi:ATP/maltotriose-dependent transcriptional regulator MalT